MPGELRDEVRAEVRAAVADGLAGARVSGVAVLSAGRQHRVLDLALDRAPGRVVARLADPAASPAVDLARTAAAAAMAGAAGVPVPRTIALRRAAGPAEWDCLLLERAPGVPWSTRHPSAGPAAVSALHAQVRAVQTALRSVRFSSFGELDAEGRPDGTTLLAALRRRCELRVGDRRRRALATRVLDQEAASLDDADGAVLVHDDLHAANLLVSEDDPPRLTAVLDWDKAWAGPADGDLARTAFWDGLPDLEPADRGPLQERRLLVLQLLWCLERVDAAPRHTADTARLCERLGVPPP